MQKGRLIVQPMGGLANRMRVLSTTLSFAKQEDANLICWWKNNEELGADYHELFLNPKINVVHVGAPGYVMFKPKKSWKRVIAIFRSLLWRKRKHIDVVINYSDTEKWVEETRDDDGECKALFLYIASFLTRGKCVFICTGDWLGKTNYAIFEPQSVIKNNVAQFINSHHWLKEHTYGIHIRRTDNNWAIEHSPISLFIEKMESTIEEDPVAMFYLASDDLDTIEQLKSKFGARILSREKDFSRKSHKGMQDAMVDMWLLSNTKKIYGSYFSSFSEAAAELGNVELEIIKL